MATIGYHPIILFYGTVKGPFAIKKKNNNNVLNTDWQEIIKIQQR